MPSDPDIERLRQQLAGVQTNNKVSPLMFLAPLADALNPGQPPITMNLFKNMQAKKSEDNLLRAKLLREQLGGLLDIKESKSQRTLRGQQTATSKSRQNVLDKERDIKTVQLAFLPKELAANLDLTKEQTKAQRYLQEQYKSRQNVLDKERDIKTVQLAFLPKELAANLDLTKEQTKAQRHLQEQYKQSAFASKKLGERRAAQTKIIDKLRPIQRKQGVQDLWEQREDIEAKKLENMQALEKHQVLKIAREVSETTGDPSYYINAVHGHKVELEKLGTVDEQLKQTSLWQKITIGKKFRDSEYGPTIAGMAKDVIAADDGPITTKIGLDSLEIVSNYAPSRRKEGSGIQIATVDDQVEAYQDFKNSFLTDEGSRLLALIDEGKALDVIKNFYYFIPQFVAGKGRRGFRDLTPEGFLKEILNELGFSLDEVVKPNETIRPGIPELNPTSFEQLIQTGTDNLPSINPPVRAPVQTNIQKDRERIIAAGGLQ